MKVVEHRKTIQPRSSSLSGVLGSRIGIIKSIADKVSGYFLRFLNLNDAYVLFDSVITIVGDFTITLKSQSFEAGVYVLGNTTAGTYGVLLNPNSIVVRIGGTNYTIAGIVVTSDEIVVSRVGATISATMGSVFYGSVAASSADLIVNNIGQRLASGGFSRDLEIDYMVIDGHINLQFPEGTGTTTADSSGNGNNGTLSTFGAGIPTWEPIL